MNSVSLFAFVQDLRKSVLAVLQPAKHFAARRGI